MATCPSCGNGVAPDAGVCRHCFHVLDRRAWEHEAGDPAAGRADRRRQPADPVVDSVPTAVHIDPTSIDSILRMFGAAFRDWRRARKA